jgi:hypothetical protein
MTMATTAWAAREVGLAADATPGEVRAALLREVTRAGFVLSPARQQAWQVLAAPPAAARPRPPGMLAAEEVRLRSEVDDFAASFFATPVGARRQRWQALAAECAALPPLAARLAALGPGLGLDLRLSDIGNPRTAQLASHVAGLFVLGPAARAAQRQAVVRALQTDIAGWEETARQLQAVSPALAALEPSLLTSILTWREQQQRLARVRAARPPLAPRQAARPAARPAAPAPSGSGGRAVGWGAVLAIIFAVRFCGGLWTHSPSPSPPPQIQIPRIDPDQPERMRRLMEDLERHRREAEELNKQRGRPGDGVPQENDARWPLVPEREDQAPLPRKP